MDSAALYYLFTIFHNNQTTYRTDAKGFHQVFMVQVKKWVDNIWLKLRRVEENKFLTRGRQRLGTLVHLLRNPIRNLEIFRNTKSKIRNFSCFPFTYLHLLYKVTHVLPLHWVITCIVNVSIVTMPPLAVLSWSSAVKVRKWIDQA